MKTQLHWLFSSVALVSSMVAEFSTIVTIADANPTERPITRKTSPGMVIDQQRNVLTNCGGCHDLTKRRRELVGPPLFGIFGRQPYQKSYSLKMWDEKALDTLLAKPSKLNPRTVMAFSYSDKKRRAAIIKALKALK